MKRLHRVLLILLAPLTSLLVRLPFVMGRETLYGFDPYLHLHFIKSWLRQETWPLTNPFATTLQSDYNAWPGAHILMATISKLTGQAPFEVMQWIPNLVMVIMVMALVLTCLRWTNIYIAVIIGIVASVADHLCLQTQWYVPELLGLVLVANMILCITVVRGKGLHILGYLILTGILVTHHFSMFIALIYYILMNKGPLDRFQLILAAVVSLETVAFWGHATKATGSFPDIQNQIGGTSPGLVVVGLVILLLVAKFVVEKIFDRYIKEHLDRSFFQWVKVKLGKPGQIAAIGGVCILILATFIIYYSSLSRLDGTGAQPAKIALVISGVLFLMYAPMRRAMVNYGIGFAAVFLLFVITPVLFEFLPLRTRFLEFLYLTGFMLGAFGFHYLYKGQPKNLKVILAAMVLLIPIMVVDDHVRLSDEYALRFVFTDEDIEFAEMIGRLTEEDAIIVTPFCYSPVVYGISERRTDTHPVRPALEAGDYHESLPFLEERAEEGPVYLVHSSRWIFYLETENDKVTEWQVASLGASLEGMASEFELVVQEGHYSLYRYVG